MSSIADPPEESALPNRVYSRDWRPPNWRGSLDEIVSAARAAIDELARQNPEHNPRHWVRLNYVDGSSQDFGSVDALQEAAPSIAPTEISGLSIRVEVKDRGVATASAEISASVGSGLRVKAKGTETFASGMVATLKSRLAGGSEAGEKASDVPFRPIDIIVLVLVALGPAAVFLWRLDSEDLTKALSYGAVALILVLGVAVFVVGGYQSENKPPPFVLVPEGEQFPDEGEDRTGPVWSAKAWFDRHPALRFSSVLVTGVVLGRAAELIKF